MVAEVGATLAFGLCILGGVSKYPDTDPSTPYGTVSADSEQQALLAGIYVYCVVCASNMSVCLFFI